MYQRTWEIFLGMLAPSIIDMPWVAGLGCQGAGLNSGCGKIKEILINLTETKMCLPVASKFFCIVGATHLQ